LVYAFMYLAYVLLVLAFFFMYSISLWTFLRLLFFILWTVV